MTTGLTETDREVLVRISRHEPMHVHQILANGRLDRALVVESIGNLTDAGLIGCTQRGWYVR
jgi:predicted transcriptional regulator